jgi:N-acetylneuraminate synthase
MAATFFGISSLERHITLDRAMYGSDQAASLEFKGMINLVESLEKMKIAFGESKLGHVTEEEKIIAKKLRAHIK